MTWANIHQPLYERKSGRYASALVSRAQITQNCGLGGYNFPDLYLNLRKSSPCKIFPRLGQTNAVKPDAASVSSLWKAALGEGCSKHQHMESGT